MSDGLGWINARVLRQNIEIVLQGRNSCLLLPVILDDFVPLRVQVEDFRVKVIVFDPKQAFLLRLGNLDRLWLVPFLHGRALQLPQLKVC